MRRGLFALAARATWVVVFAVALSAKCYSLGVDCNGNGVVGPADPEDPAIVIDAWQHFHAGDANWDQRGDVDGDGDVDYYDATLVIEAFLSGRQPEGAQLASYFRMPPDSTLLWEKRGLIRTAERILSDSDSTVRDVWSNEFVEVFLWWAWEIENGAATKLVTFVEPWTTQTVLTGKDTGGVELPKWLYMGTQWTKNFAITNEHNRPDLVGTGSLSLTLLAVDQTVTVPAGEFHHCIEIKFELAWHLPASDSAYVFWIWLAPGVGPVQRTTDPDPLHGQYEKLYWASLGGQEYGQRPETQVNFGLGAQYFWKCGDSIHGQQFQFEGGGQTGRLVDMRQPADSYTLWQTTWLAPNESPFLMVRVTGFVGWSEWEQGGEYILAQPFEFSGRWPLGMYELLTTSVAHGGDPNYGEAAVYARVVGVDQTVNTPAGRFDHCFALAIKVELRRPNSARVAIRRIYWFNADYGPVQYEDDMAPSAPAVYQLVYAYTPTRHTSVGHLDQTTFDYLRAVDWQIDDARKLVDGNAWRIVTTGGWEMMPDGKLAWVVLDVRGVGYNTNSLTVNTEYYNVTPQGGYFYYYYYGQRPDPATFGEDVYLQPASISALLGQISIGNVFGPATELKKGDETVKVLVRQCQWTGEESIWTPAGNFMHTHVVWVSDKETDPHGNVISWIARKQYFDEDAGLVAEIEWDYTQVPPRLMHVWRLQWARAHDNTYGDYPGRVDLLTRFPIHEHDEWRFGNANSLWHQWIIGAPDVPTGATEQHFPLTWRRWHGDQKQAVNTEWWQRGSNTYALAYEQPSEPNALQQIWQLTPAVQLQRWWYVGGAKAYKLTVKQPGQSLEWPGREVWIMLEGGLTEDVPAGHFENCCRLLRLSTRGGNYGWKWRYYDMYMAPSSGPVYVVTKESPYIFGSPGLVKWILLPGRSCGHWP